MQLDAVAGADRGGGSVAVGPAEFDVVLDGGSLYVKGTAGTWTEVGYGASAAALAGHWWRTPASAKPFDLFANLVNVGALASLLESAPGLAEGPSTKFGGIPVVPLAAAGGQRHHLLRHCVEESRSGGGQRGEPVDDVQGLRRRHSPSGADWGETTGFHPAGSAVNP